jgi:hypothetical protein
MHLKASVHWCFEQKAIPTSDNNITTEIAAKNVEAVTATTETTIAIKRTATRTRIEADIYQAVYC